MHFNSFWLLLHYFSPSGFEAGLGRFLNILQPPQCLYLQFHLFTDHWRNICSNTCPKSEKWCFAIYHLIFNGQNSVLLQTQKNFHRWAPFDDKQNNIQFAWKYTGIQGGKHQIFQTNKRCVGLKEAAKVDTTAAALPFYLHSKRRCFERLQSRMGFTQHQHEWTRPRGFNATATDRPLLLTPTCCVTRSWSDAPAEMGGLAWCQWPPPPRPEPHSSDQQIPLVFDLWSRIIPHQLNDGWGGTAGRQRRVATAVFSFLGFKS